jgi:hypothetical protein
MKKVLTIVFIFSCLFLYLLVIVPQVCNAAVPNDWRCFENGEYIEAIPGYLYGDIINTDPIIRTPDNLDLSISSTNNNKIYISMKNSTSVTSARIRFTTNSDTIENFDKSKGFTINANDPNHTEYVIDMSTVQGWTGTLKQLRIDPVEPGDSSGSFSIDYVRIGPKGMWWEFTGGDLDWTCNGQVSGFAMIGGSNYVEGFSTFVLPNGDWLATASVAPDSTEGGDSCHIVCATSTDEGATWSEFRDIEPEGPPESYYPTLMIHPETEELICLYAYNYYNVQEYPDESDLRGDCVSVPAYRISTNNGITWGERHVVLQTPKTQIDYDNVFEGDYILSYVGRWWPSHIQGDDGYGVLMKSGPKYYSASGSDSECYIVKYANYANASNFDEQTITLSAPVNDPGQYMNDATITYLSGSSVWISYRTGDGKIGLAKSTDMGANWTIEYLKYTPEGRLLKNTNSPIWNFTNDNGDKFMHFYNDSTLNTYMRRDIVYVTHFYDVSGVRYHTEPEVTLYGITQSDRSNDLYTRLNPPKYGNPGSPYIVQDSTVLGKVGDKLETRHINPPESFFNTILTQPTINVVEPDAEKTMTAGQLCGITSTSMTTLSNPGDDGSFTIDLWARFNSTTSGQVLIDSYSGSTGIKVTTDSNNRIKFYMGDGTNSITLTSNDNSIGTTNEHHIVIVVDGMADLIYMVVDGLFQDGGSERTRGTTWFTHDMVSVNGSSTLTLGNSANITLKGLRIYNKALMTTHAIGNFRYGITNDGKQWEFSSTIEGWTANGQVSGFGWQTGGYIGANIINTDPIIRTPDNLGLSISSTNNNKIYISMKNNTSVTSARIRFITNSDTTENFDKSKGFTINANDPNYTEYEIDMSTVQGWTATLKQVRIDPVEPGDSSGSFSIDYVRIGN